MKKLKENWALIGFILAFLLDNQLGLVELMTQNETWQEVIKGIGAILLAYFWNNGKSIGGGGILNPPPKNKTKSIGGGGILNPPPKK